MPPMKYWEIVADKLSAAGFSWGYCSAVTKYAGDGSLTRIAAMVAANCPFCELLSEILSWSG